MSGCYIPCCYIMYQVVVVGLYTKLPYQADTSRERNQRCASRGIDAGRQRKLK